METTDLTPLTPPAPPAGSVSHRVQRAVLLELLAVAGITTVSELARRLQLDVATVRTAAAALADAGLAERDGDAVAAAPAASYFDALWPIAI